MADNEREVLDLVARLEVMDKTYHDGNGENVLDDDEEYDALRDRLQVIAPEHPYSKKVGAPVQTGNWPKKTHQAPMGSLDKVKGVTGLREWFEKTSKGPR